MHLPIVRSRAHHNLLTIVFLLPIIVLSALTTGFVQLLLAILMPCLIALGVVIIAPEIVLSLPSGSASIVRLW
jgi:hypothetical protein